MKIAVFLGANKGNNPKIEQETKKLGNWIGLASNTLVYGGSWAGLMGVIAKSTQQTGGKVIGVELKLFDDQGASYYDLDQFILTDTIQERKRLMLEMSDAFIAIPGGVGTLDEISEIICVNKIDKKHRPVILLNTDGFYNGLHTQIQEMVKYQFLSKEDADLIIFADNVDQIIEILSK